MPWGQFNSPRIRQRPAHALLGFEKRDLIPNKALIWNNAAALAEREPNTCLVLLAEWRSMARGNDNMRLLVVEARWRSSSAPSSSQIPSH